MKSIYFFLVFLLTSTTLSAQTYTGNLTLTSQSEVDAFNYDKIVGNFTIKGLGIVNLSNLEKLDTVFGDLTIDSTNILNVNGLRNVKTKEGRNLIVSNNPQLENVSDLNDYLRSKSWFGRVVISNNPKIIEIKSFLSTERFTYIDELHIDNNDKLQEVNLFNTSRIAKLYVQNNLGIKKITFPNANYEEDFYHIQIENNSSLDSIVYFENPFTDYGYFILKNNPSLRYIQPSDHYRYFNSFDIENNSSLSSMDFIQQLGDDEDYVWIESIRVVNNANLSDCCNLERILSANVYSFALIERNPFPCNNIVQIVTSCGGSLNENFVFGRVYIDANANNKPDSEDVFLENIKIQTTKRAKTITRTTEQQGEYFFISDTGLYKIEPITGFANFQTSPLTHSISHTTYGNFDTLDFKVSADILLNNASISLTSTAVTRPGRNNSYNISYTNESGKMYNGTAKLVLDNRLTYTGASLAPDLVVGDTLYWNINNLPMFTTKHIRVDVVGSAFLVANDILTSLVQIYNAEVDVTPEDNSFTFNDVVRASFDPNNKVVNKTILSPEEVSNAAYLFYTIHFQNVGNDTAFTVSISDELDASLDWNTIEMIASSHEYEFEQVDGKNIHFYFDEIHLPDSNVNEKGSKGYISYKIKPKSSLVIGNMITNEASIVFDFNAPIYTNSVVTAVMQTSAGTDKTICEGESITLTASGATSYTWVGGSSGANYIATPKTTTTFYVIGKVGGITQEDSVIVYVNPTIETILTEVISSGETYDFNGIVLTESGIYTDTLQQTNGCDSIIVLNLEMATAIKNNIDIVNSVKIFPNPGNKHFTVDLKAQKQATFTISLLSVDGKILFLKEYNNTAVIYDDIDISRLSLGMYYLRIVSENDQATYNVLKH